MNFSQITDITIPDGTVTQITANSAVLWKKQTSPWSDEFTVSGNRRNFSISYTTNSATLPEKVVYEVTGLTGISTPNPILYGANNYFISTRDTNVTQNGTNYWIIYPKWTATAFNNEWTCNCYYGSTSGTSCTLNFNANTKLLSFSWINNNTTSSSISAKIRVAINEDPTFDDFTSILTGNWNWDAKTSSSWGSSTTAFDNFTLPLKYTRIQFNALNVTSNPTSSSFTINYAGKSSNYKSYPMDYANLDKYVIEIPASNMTTSNTTTPATHYFDLIGSSSSTELQFFPAEYLSNSRNRFSWQRKYINATTYSLNIKFKIWAQQ